MVGSVVGEAQNVVEVMLFPGRDMRVRGVGDGWNGAGGSEKGEIGLGVGNVHAVES